MSVQVTVLQLGLFTGGLPCYLAGRWHLEVLWNVNSGVWPCRGEWSHRIRTDEGSNNKRVTDSTRTKVAKSQTKRRVTKGSRGWWRVQDSTLPKSWLAFALSAAMSFGPCGHVGSRLMNVQARMQLWIPRRLKSKILSLPKMGSFTEGFPSHWHKEPMDVAVHWIMLSCVYQYQYQLISYSVYVMYLSYHILYT